jgi:hypothetical protein
MMMTIMCSAYQVTNVNYPVLHGQASSGLRLGLELPIQPAKLQVTGERWYVRQLRLISSGLEQQDAPIRILRQAVGNDGPRGSSSDCQKKKKNRT